MTRLRVETGRNDEAEVAEKNASPGNVDLGLSSDAFCKPNTGQSHEYSELA